MFRVFFFILIFSFTLYGIWGLYAPFRAIDKQDLNERYQTYLSEALDRSILESKSYDIVFYTKDFSDKDNSTLDNTNNAGEKISNKNQASYNSSLLSESERIASPRGNFGTPEITITPSISLRDSTCAGIFYDPCVTLNIPDNGELENMYLGTTPIYDDPRQRG